MATIAAAAAVAERVEVVVAEAVAAALTMALGFPRSTIVQIVVTVNSYSNKHQNSNFN